MNAFLTLAVAIAFEVAATSALKVSEGFTRPIPTSAALVGYGISFWALSLTLRTMPMGVAYAIWSGIGIVVISAIGWAVFGQKLDGPAILGMGLIVAGVLVLNLLSKATGH